MLVISAVKPVFLKIVLNYFCCVKIGFLCIGSKPRLMLKLASEAPVTEDTLMRLLVIGLWRELPLSAPDAVELVEQLVCRAASLYYDCKY